MFSGCERVQPTTDLLQEEIDKGLVTICRGDDLLIRAVETAQTIEERVQAALAPGVDPCVHQPEWQDH